jgi:hypothetical protein
VEHGWCLAWLCVRLRLASDHIQSVAVIPSATALDPSETTLTPSKLTATTAAPRKSPSKPDAGMGRGKTVLLPVWLPQHVYDLLLLPYIIGEIGIDSNIWDLESDSRLLAISQEGLHKVIVSEDLGIEAFELKSMDSFYRHAVSASVLVSYVAHLLMTTTDPTKGVRLSAETLSLRGCSHQEAHPDHEDEH